MSPVEHSLLPRRRTNREMGSLSREPSFKGIMDGQDCGCVRSFGRAAENGYGAEFLEDASLLEPYGSSRLPHCAISLAIGY